MRLLTREKTRADERSDAVVTGLLSLLEDQTRKARDKGGLTGVRAVAAGAAIYSAGFAAFKGRRFVRDFGARMAREDQPDASKEKRMRRAAREKPAQPSLVLPRRRWTRMAVSRE